MDSVRAESTRREIGLRSEAAPGSPAILLLIDPDGPRHLQASRNRRWTRLAARLLASSLDRQLAEGRSPESHKLLAARARLLVSPTRRAELAADLARVGERSRRAPVPRSPKVTVNCHGIAACAQVLQQACDALVAPRPTSARGVAIISGLLSDGTGPLYDNRRSAELSPTLCEAIDQL
jgi:hypothetical protein